MLAKPLVNPKTQARIPTAPDVPVRTVQATDILPYHDIFGDHGPPILLVHGYMVDGAMYQPVVDDYVHHGYTVFVPDLRGYGMSKNMEGPYTIEQHAADMVAIMDAYGINQMTVTGYSMGGTVAQTLALEYPERVSILILTATFAYKAATALERLQERLLPTVLNRVGPEGLARLLNPDWLGFTGIPPEAFRYYQKTIKNNNEEVLLHSAKDLFSYDARPRLKHISQPTLVVGGTADFIAPVHHTYELAGGIPGAKIKVYENAGHALINTHDDAYAEHTIKFIERTKERLKTG